MRTAILVAALAATSLLGCTDPTGPPRERTVVTVAIWGGTYVDESRPRDGYTYCLDVSGAWAGEQTIEATLVGYVYEDVVVLHEKRWPRDLTHHNFIPAVWPVPFCDDTKWAEQFVQPDGGRDRSAKSHASQDRLHRGLSWLRRRQRD